MKLMKVLEPITAENLSELRPGEWIWDNNRVSKIAHKRSLKQEKIFEPVGFRQIHILDLAEYPRFTDKPFMLSDVYRGKNTWERFVEGRFFKFKWDMLKEMEQ